MRTDPLGELIRRVLREAPFAMRQLAADAGLSYDVLRSWRSGRRRPSRASAQRLAVGLEQRGERLLRLARELREAAQEPQQAQPPQQPQQPQPSQQSQPSQQQQPDGRLQDVDSPQPDAERDAIDRSAFGPSGG